MTDKTLNILFASYLEPEYVEQIRNEFPQLNLIYRPDLVGQPRYKADHSAKPQRSEAEDAEWKSLLQQADILFDFDYFNLDALPELAPNVKWIQSSSAGIGQLVKRTRYSERTSWVLTTSSGIHARPLAEFAIMAMIMFAKNYLYLQQEKQNHNWQRYASTKLAGKTVAIVGLGKIGREVAKLAKAFDMNVIGNRRDPQKSVTNVDHLYGPDELNSLLKNANFLVLATPHTPETEGLIGAAQIAQLPQGAVIINIARGAVMHQNALIENLQSGHLQGAALDVFEVEPLPADNPLWDMPNVIISPHSASTADTENKKLTDLFCENLRRYLNNDPMLNVLNTDLLY